MIVLINGESCTGKTLMAQRLMEEYKLPYYSEDHLKMGWIKGDVDCPFSADDSNEEISSYLYPMLKGIITTAIENHQHLIMEGCYILPKHLKDISEEYISKIVIINLVFSEDYIRKNLYSSIMNNRDNIENRLYPENRSVEQVISEHKAFKEKCEEYSFSYFEIRNDYETELEEIYDWVAAEIASRNLLMR